MTPRSLTGTVHLVAVIARRDRVRLALWLRCLTAFTLASVAALPGLYPEAVDRQARAVLVQNPGTRAISGPGYGLDDYTFGAMVGHEYLSWVAVFVALMSIFTVVRHTRLEEEAGRAELIRASRVGRHAMTTAALAVAVGANAVLAVLLAVGIGSLGIADVGWEGSVLFSAAVASTGVVFAAVAAVAVQVNASARGANGLAGAVLVLAYTLRAAGDMAALGGNALSWLSPIGWAQQTRVYVDDRWWPLGLSAVAVGALVAAAYALSTRRDVGASLVPPRPGRAHARDGLTTPLGLAWRLHRSSVAWWSLAVGLFAVGYGTLATEVERFVSEMSVIEDAVADLGGTIIDAWLAIITLVFAVLATVFAVVATVRARSEEVSGRAEALLATTSRRRWLASHLVVALAGSALLMVLTGVGLGVSVASSLGDGAYVTRVLGAALAHVPAIWLVIGITVALYGVAPRITPLAWAVVAYAGIVGWLGQLLQFPQWALDLSPLGHTPLLPAEGMRWAPLVVLAVAAVALVVVGQVTFARRDIHSTA